MVSAKSTLCQQVQQPTIAIPAPAPAPGVPRRGVPAAPGMPAVAAFICLLIIDSRQQPIVTVVVGWLWLVMVGYGWLWLVLWFAATESDVPAKPVKIF